MKREIKLAIAYIGIIDVLLYLIVVAAFIMKGSPIFLSGMEIVTIISAIFILIFLETILDDCPLEKLFWKRFSYISMTCSICLTSVAHFVNLTITRPLINEGVDVSIYFQIGQWPSVEMAIDYLAWGLFLGLAFICAAFTIPKKNSPKMLRGTILLSGCLCLIGFMGPVMNIVSMWYIAVMGYTAGIAVMSVEIIIFYKGKKG
jgi:hypothetical protein